MDFAMVLAELLRFVRERGLRHSIAGALALHGHGLSRATQDLDVALEEAGRAALLEHLAALGYEKLHESEGYSNHLHRDPLWGRIDVIYLEGKTADIFFAGARPTELFLGVTVPVPRAEHLAAMKAQAVKENPRRASKDLADVAALLNLPDIDVAEIRRYFDKYGLGAEFERIMRERGLA